MGVFLGALHESDVILPLPPSVPTVAVLGTHDAPTLGDPMTYGYQIVDLVEFYQNIYNMSYFALQKSALFGVGKWSIFEPKVNFKIK